MLSRQALILDINTLLDLLTSGLTKTLKRLGFFFSFSLTLEDRKFQLKFYLKAMQTPIYFKTRIIVTAGNLC